jgi:hypothetical protein
LRYSLLRDVISLVSAPGAKLSTTIAIFSAVLSAAAAASRSEPQYDGSCAPQLANYLAHQPRETLKNAACRRHGDSGLIC